MFSRVMSRLMFGRAPVTFQNSPRLIAAVQDQVERRHEWHEFAMLLVKTRSEHFVARDELVQRARDDLPIYRPADTAAVLEPEANLLAFVDCDDTTPREVPMRRKHWLVPATVAALMMGGSAQAFAQQAGGRGHLVGLGHETGVGPVDRCRCTGSDTAASGYPGPATAQGPQSWPCAVPAEATLLKLAYAYEQAARPRKPPRFLPQWRPA